MPPARAPAPETAAAAQRRKNRGATTTTTDLSSAKAKPTTSHKRKRQTEAMTDDRNDSPVATIKKEVEEVVVVEDGPPTTAAEVSLPSAAPPPEEEDDDDVHDLVWPSRHGVVGTPGECTLLLQIDPEDAEHVDLGGTAGAIGRLEVDDEGVILDMKGRQYHGRIFPGPTALVLGTQTLPVGKSAQDVADATSRRQLKVLGITDEFAQCIRQQRED